MQNDPSDTSGRTPGRIVVLLNPKAGSAGNGGLTAENLASVLRNCGLKGEVWSVSHDELPESARDAARSGADAVVAAGGDGTVSTVAAALVDTGVPLGILPLGTLNHFARDLGIPNGLEEAAALLAERMAKSSSAPATPVDVGDVNGRTFINNVSLGLYPHFVRTRRSVRRRKRKERTAAFARLRAQLVAAWRVFSRSHSRFLRVRVESGGLRVADHVSVVVVGNNEYGEGLLDLGVRRRLDRGRLGVGIARGHGRFTLLRLIGSALFGRLTASPQFVSFPATRLEVDAPSDRLQVGIDGEVVQMRTPLVMRSRPGALRVVAPESAASSPWDGSAGVPGG